MGRHRILGTPSNCDISPAAMPSGSCMTMSLKASSRVGWARAAKVSIVLYLSMYRDLSICVCVSIRKSMRGLCVVTLATTAGYWRRFPKILHRISENPLRPFREQWPHGAYGDADRRFPKMVEVLCNAQISFAMLLKGEAGSPSTLHREVPPCKTDVERDLVRGPSLMKLRRTYSPK